MKKLIIVTLNVLLSTVAFCQYSANYKEINVIPLEGLALADSPLEIDTNNLEQANHILVIMSSKCYFNQRYGYFECKIRKSNIPSAAGQTERILIDYKEKVMYDLNTKKAHPLKKQNLKVNLPGDDQNQFTVELPTPGDTATITLDKSIPKEIRSTRLLNTDLPAGIHSVLSAKLSSQLQSWQKESFDFKPVIKEALQCIPTGKEIDLLFR